MLYDPKWANDTIYSIQSFIAWLEKQPRGINYDWFDISDCVVCKYLKAKGLERPTLGPGYDKVFSSSDEYRSVAGAQPWTYGATLARAKAVAQSRM